MTGEMPQPLCHSAGIAYVEPQKEQGQLNTFGPENKRLAETFRKTTIVMNGNNLLTCLTRIRISFAAT